MWHGFVQFLLWLARPFRSIHLYRKTVGQTKNPPSRDHSPQASLEKTQSLCNQLSTSWMIYQCPSFSQNLNHIASKISSIQVMTPMLTIAPIRLAVYYTREPKTTPQKPIVISQEPSGLITINAQPIHHQKETDTYNLCGISTVHSSAIPPLSPTDLMHPSSIILGTDQTPAAELLTHWTAVLEQLSPSLKGLIKVVIMIDHTAVHGHQDFSPKRIIMTMPKKRITYQVPPTVFQHLLPQQSFEFQMTQTPLPAESQSPQTFPPPPTPPRSWQRQTPTPTREESPPTSSGHMSLQTSTSESSSSRASSPGSSASATLTPRYTTYNGPRKGVLDLQNLQN